MERAGSGVGLTVRHRDERQIDTAVETADVPGLHDVILIIGEGDEPQLREMPVDHHGVLIVTPVVKTTAQIEADGVTLKCTS